jgi:hypothetical protein
MSRNVSLRDLKSPESRASAARQILSQPHKTPAETKKPKYGNQRTLVGELWFDSKREAARWQELCLLQRAGQISKLEAHPKFALAFNGVAIGRYTPDFIYDVPGKGQVVEDVKSGPTMTTASRLRIKCFEAIYRVTVKIIT